MMSDDVFAVMIAEKGRELYRPMPWRENVSPYFVLVSEIMLQQTQVDRVRQKFAEFILRFPDFESLAGAPLADVLMLWSGLGYNRRAKYLHDAAKAIMHDGGILPDNMASLIALPGVGVNTAGALLAYVYNQPTIFVETNVRTVYLHHFFTDEQEVSDADIKNKLATTLDTTSPRQFYWSLMDYGAWLKSNGYGRLSQSRHYQRQSPLKGSVREVRGEIVRELTLNRAGVSVNGWELTQDSRFLPALHGLMTNGLIRQEGDRLYLTE